MKNLEYWDEIEGLGTFQLEMELVVSTEPVLFVCQKDEERYLFMTYDSYEGIFVFCKIATCNLIKMLRNELTMENAFRLGECIYQTYVDEKGNMQYERYETCSFDGDKLPRKGAYYRIHSEYIQNYIRELYLENVTYVPYDCRMTIAVVDWKFEFSTKVKVILGETERYNCFIDEVGKNMEICENYEVVILQSMENNISMDSTNEKKSNINWAA